MGRRGLPGALALLLIASSSWHCNRKERGGEDPGTVVVLLETEVGEIDPRHTSGSYDIKVSRLVFSGLTTSNTPDLSPRPLLAESIEQTDEEGLEWRVVLREGLAFHDGRPLTAEDVVFTYRSVADPEAASRYRATYDYIESVEAVDARTLRFRLDEPNASFLPDLGLPILPAHVLGSTSARFPEDGVVGSGPFRLVEMRPGRVVLERHPPPAEGSDDVRRLVFMTVRDDNARVLRLKGGGADLAQNNVPFHMIGLFEETDSMRVVSSPGASFTYVGLNTEEPPLDDPRVRRALLVAIDREAVTRHKFHGRARPATGMLPPMHWAHEPDVDRHPHDPDLARRLLDEAGLHDPEGPDPRFTLVFKVGSNRFRLAVARVIASYWRDVGIDVDVRPFEFSTLMSHLDSGSFQATCLQIPMVMEPNLYRWFFHSSSIPEGPGSGGANRWRYRSAEADALIDEGVRVVDKDGRRDVYSALQQMLARDLPVLPLWHEDSVAVAAQGLGDWEILPTAPFTPLAGATLSR